MNYENQICPLCGKPFKKDDDVVVCPECATPHHRACWRENGRCVNEGLHGSGFYWKRKEPVRGESPENGSEEEKNVCAFCGSENAAGAARCEFCGAPLGEEGEIFKTNPFLAGSGIDPEEKIGENAAGELAVYVQANSKKYVPKFRKFEEGKPVSFNFAAFFFSPYWFFYRKLYKAGIFFLVLFVATTLALSGFSSRIVNAATEFTREVETAVAKDATEAEIKAAEGKFERAAAEFYEKTRRPATVVASIYFAVRLVCALAADRLYYKKVKTDLKTVNDGVADKTLKTIAAARRGGTSALAFAASLFGYDALFSLLAYAAEALIR